MFTAHMDFYEPAELEQVLTRSAGILGIELGADAGTEIARRSRGTPRIANRLLRRVRDYAEVRADGVITLDVAKAALEVYDVDELGLDRLDRAVLTSLIRSFGGGPVGVSTLAVAVGEEATTVEEVCEPFLVRAGMIARTPRGRVATALAWTHLGFPPPSGLAPPSGLELPNPDGGGGGAAGSVALGDWPFPSDPRSLPSGAAVSASSFAVWTGGLSDGSLLPYPV